jgi:hypothetical protein
MLNWKGNDKRYEKLPSTKHNNRPVHTNTSIQKILNEKKKIKYCSIIIIQNIHTKSHHRHRIIYKTKIKITKK